MNFEKLEQDVSKIVKISEKIPEKYQAKCFEILLNQLVSGYQEPSQIPKLPSPPVKKQTFDFQIPIEVRAFLRQFSIDEGKIFELFLITGKDEIVPTFKIRTTVISKAQIQIALMVALENTLKQTERFQFSIEEVRQRCQDNKVYDRKNFQNHFNNNKKLFKDLSDKEHVLLSPYGKEKLAEVINEL